MRMRQLIVVSRYPISACSTEDWQIVTHPVFESDGNAWEHRSRSFLYNGNFVPVVFSIYRTRIVNRNLLWMSFGYGVESLEIKCVR